MRKGRFRERKRKLVNEFVSFSVTNRTRNDAINRYHKMILIDRNIRYVYVLCIPHETENVDANKYKFKKKLCTKLWLQVKS